MQFHPNWPSDMEEKQTVDASTHVGRKIRHDIIIIIIIIIIVIIIILYFKKVILVS